MWWKGLSERKATGRKTHRLEVVRHWPECELSSVHTEQSHVHLPRRKLLPSYRSSVEAMSLVFKIYLTYTQIPQGGQHGLIALDWLWATADQQRGALLWTRAHWGSIVPPVNSVFLWYTVINKKGSLFSCPKWTSLPYLYRQACKYSQIGSSRGKNED